MMVSHRPRGRRIRTVPAQEGYDRPGIAAGNKSVDRYQVCMYVVDTGEMCVYIVRVLTRGLLGNSGINLRLAFVYVVYSLYLGELYRTGVACNASQMHSHMRVVVVTYPEALIY